MKVSLQMDGLSQVFRKYCGTKYVKMTTNDVARYAYLMADMMLNIRNQKEQPND